MNPFQYTVSFRIVHPHLDPGKISAKLSLIPNISWMAGSRRSTPTGKPLEGNYEMSYWSYLLECQPGTGLAACLDTFTISLEPYKEFLAEIRFTGGRCEYFIGWFSSGNSGEVFNYQLLSKLSRLQIDLAFDMYGQSAKTESNKL